MKKVLITGTNSGFGMLSVLELAKSGYFVIATVRDINKSNELLDLASQMNVHQNIEIYLLDLEFSEQIYVLKEKIVENHGSIDVLINNAGYCLGGLTEEVPICAWRNQFEVNYFGTLQMIQQFLPLLKKNKGSRIINISSVSGLLGLPGFGPYASSKFAIEGLSESLRLELLSENVYVSLVEPAAYKTKIWEKGLEDFKKNADSSHILKSKLLKEATNSYENGSDPIEVANLIVKICHTDKPKFRYPIGNGARFLYIAKRISPWSLVEWFARRKLK